MNKILVTGGAGFIGSHLIDRLLDEGNQVICIDNFILGRIDNLKKANKNKFFKLYEEDLLNLEKIDKIFNQENFNTVYHLAANSDIRESQNTSRDLNLTFMTTYNVLECMKKHKVKNLIFTSTPAVFGNKTEPLVEEMTANPESAYGASKLASEFFIKTFSNLYGINCWIVRLSNIVGERTTHGVIHDFLIKVEENKKELKVLGDGNQSKPYMYVKDIVDAIIFIFKNSSERINVYNVGPKDSTKVSEIAEMLLKECNLKREIVYGSEKFGWKGDVPYYTYNANKLENLGWKTKYNSSEAVRIAIKNIVLSREN